MAVAHKLIFGLLAAVSVIGFAYFALDSRQANLQANVYVSTKAEVGQFPDLAKACPNEVASTRQEEADYTLTVVWVDKGWFYALERKDGATLEPDLYRAKNTEDPNAARIVRRVCSDIRRDFPLWLNTQRVRASIGKAAQTGATTSLDDDPPRRYEMTEYRNGPIVGIALLDTKVGRTWLLTNITDSSGKTVRTKFNEVSVEDLWQSSDELYDSHFKWPQDHIDRASRVKDLTRPIAIQRAENQAAKSP